MDTRVLKYFLTVANTNNITKAAKQLHITQPTLSRQIMELEKELDVALFDRTQRQLQLTKAGVLFQQRATTLLQLVDQTKDDLHQQEKELVGSVNLGCVVSLVSPFMMKMVNDFQKEYPGVRFNIFDGDGDALRRQIDEGRLDLACLIEPVEAAKYNYVVLPIKEQWGLLMRSDDSLAQRTAISKNDLYKLPLILPHRNIVRDEVSDILKLDQTKLNWMVTNNLPSNTIELIRSGNYYAIGIKGIQALSADPEIAFIPFTPKKETGHLLIWRKNNMLAPAAERFLQFVTERSN
ncbi:LysR family transcriptional regulator [Limosilactobacillus avium]|uniref:LysR family transcriptional regulator n=1 Tax=Limosilactobacillus avium TaxID=2991831 RepID=UPI0024B9DF6D|nr:LysR family transcriptional regulator [Limosilactobacillus avium]